MGQQPTSCRQAHYLCSNAGGWARQHSPDARVSAAACRSSAARPHLPSFDVHALEGHIHSRRQQVETATAALGTVMLRSISCQLYSSANTTGLCKALKPATKGASSSHTMHSLPPQP